MSRLVAHCATPTRNLTLSGRQWSNGDVNDAALSERLRALPSVDEVLGHGEMPTDFRPFPRELVVEEVRLALDELRGDIRRGTGANGSIPSTKAELSGEIRSRVLERLARMAEPSLRRVINASGVILHTNLGRAPLSANALAAVRETGVGYSNLEYDLSEGRRGKRDVHAGARLERLLGAPAIVVNNNAAAVFLVLEELADGAEVIVSRGELIEIGDGFRIPDIMARGGARLREVGTTNRTRIDDYRDAVGEDTGALLRVHRSNFQIVGFTERPTLEELVELGHETGLPLVEDLGSGCIYDLSPHGFANEPRVSDSLRCGVDIVTFSGDKLLGGPQAGIIAGKPEWIDRIRRNPLFRALRVDKMTYAALDATLRDYQLQRWDEIPVLQMLRMSVDQIRGRAENLAEALGEMPAEIRLIEGESVPGGGATPEQTLPTIVVSIRPNSPASAESLQRRLRRGDPAVVGRCENDRLLVDLRTVSPSEDEDLLECLRVAFERDGVY